MVEKLRQEFEKKFGKHNDARIYFAPGRVNLIGEHTDYNGGHGNGRTSKSGMEQTRPFRPRRTAWPLVRVAWKRSNI